MRKFTKTEVDLCEKIAEKENRHEVEYGDWYYDESVEEVILCEVDYQTMFKYVFPLWQEHDCLEWLQKRYDSLNLNRFRDEDWEVDISDAYDKVHDPDSVPTTKGKTPLEALLRAVLAVMGGK